VYLKTSNALDFIIEDNSIAFHIIGGIIHFKFIFGDKNPETAIKKYHYYINGFNNFIF